jgi:uncharacterized C2H2 Zn-finger protein
MGSRKPKKDEAPVCEGKDCHEAKMDIIEKHGAVWYFRCPKCNTLLGDCYVKPTNKAMHEHMMEFKRGRAAAKKQEPPKPAEAPK